MKRSHIWTASISFNISYTCLKVFFFCCCSWRKKHIFSACFFPLIIFLLVLPFSLPIVGFPYLFFFGDVIIALSFSMIFLLSIYYLVSFDASSMLLEVSLLLHSALWPSSTFMLKGRFDLEIFLCFFFLSSSPNVFYFAFVQKCTTCN